MRLVKVWRSSLFHGLAISVFGAIVIARQTLAAAEGTPAPDQIAVLDAGTFIRVETHHAKLGDVIDRLKDHLNIRVTNTELLDLSRVIDGPKTGTVFEVVRWLTPNSNFILVYGGSKPGQSSPRRLERIGFLSADNSQPGHEMDGAPPSSTATGDTKSLDNENPSASVGISGIQPSSGTSAPAGDETNNLKPSTAPSEQKSEIKTVAEQLRAVTPEAQLEIEAEAHASNPTSAAPEFLQAQSDAAQTTLQQQAERSQALAVEHLNALINAYGAAGTSNSQNSPH